MLMIVRTVDWLQKLECSKILSNVNINNILKKGKDKNALDMLRHMYGKLSNPNTKEENDDTMLKSQQDALKISQLPDDNIPAIIIPEQHTDTSMLSTASEMTNNKFIADNMIEKSSSKNLMKRSDRDENGMKVSEKNANKTNLFFEIYNSSKYQGDFPGRISNFLKGALKNEYKVIPSDREKIDAIVIKYWTDYNAEQCLQIKKNYIKFCTDYNIAQNNNVVTTLEKHEKSLSSSRTASKSPPRVNKQVIKVSNIQSVPGANMRVSADSALFETRQYKQASLLSELKTVNEETKTNTNTTVPIKEVTKAQEAGTPIEIKGAERVEFQKKKKDSMKTSQKSQKGPELTDRQSRPQESGGT